MDDSDTQSHASIIMRLISVLSRLTSHSLGRVEGCDLKYELAHYSCSGERPLFGV